MIFDRRKSSNHDLPDLHVPIVADKDPDKHIRVLSPNRVKPWLQDTVR